MIRHGESETNKNRQWTGWLDVPLTERGEAEAEKVGELLSKTSFDKIYASDLSRAKKTAEIALPGCKYEVTEALREINVGNIAGKPLDVVTDDESKLLGEDGYAIFDGEGRAEFGNRVCGFMRMLEEQSCENIALFSHAGFLRQAVDTVLGVEVPRGKMCCKNCAVAIFEYSDKTWKLHSWMNLY